MAETVPSVKYIKLRSLRVSRSTWVPSAGAYSIRESIGLIRPQPEVPRTNPAAIARAVNFEAINFPPGIQIPTPLVYLFVMDLACGKIVVSER